MTRKRLGRFKILAETGRGAMGTVYRALDPTIERVVAIKTISLASPKRGGDKEFRERFFREARAAGRLSHPGIVTIHDVGEDEAVKTPFIVMEYVEGKSLEEVGQSERLPLETALELARQVAEALDYAHSRQIIHRDIKPANIIVTPEGRAKITDFGIARLALSQFTVPGEILGTPSYMAPEQLSAGEVDGRSDLFSLGVILYWMLTGQKAFTGDTASAVAFQIVYKDPPPPSQLNPVLGQEFDYVVERALAKNPDRRYQCGRDLAKDLEDLKASRTPRSRVAFASFGEAEATATADAEASELTAATATEVLPVQQGERSPGRPASPTWRRLGTAALALLLYLLLLDSAVETFLSGSPLRGIVAISVGAYLALSAWLWRRLRWPTKAAASFFFLLGLLAFALWRPESRQEGFYLLQQSTSVLACGLSALAVAVAGFILSRLKRLPRAGRVAIGVVAAYGVAGFVLGIRAGTPYAALYQGASLWTRLPFWLQGAFIGTVLILPAALLFLIVHRLVRFREAAPRAWAYKVLFLALSLTMSLGALTAPALPTVLIPVDGGKIEAVISGGINESYWPTHPTRTIPEDAEKIYAVLKANVSRPVRLEANWIAANVAGAESNQKLTSAELSLKPGERAAIWLESTGQGFLVGDYRVDFSSEGSPPRSLSFKVVPILPPALLVEPSEPAAGFNIALAALGGRVESVTSEYDQEKWAVTNLIDGTPFGPQGNPAGWSSSDNTLPQEIVFSFYQRREALVGAVIIDTATYESISQPDRIPKHVEVWASTTSPVEGFAKMGGARLLQRAAEQAIPLSPTRAKYLKVRFSSDYGGEYIQAGEIKILEASQGAQSILSDLPKNLALPALGGGIAWFTSHHAGGFVGQLVDGASATQGWRSGPGPHGPASYLPQDIVFAFRGDQIALVEWIVLNPDSQHELSTWPKVVGVSVSTVSPVDGFEEVGQFNLAQDPREQPLAIGRKARFVKLRILENFGGEYTSLGEVKILEGSAQDYRSVLLDGRLARSSATGAPLDETGIAVETEPNDISTEANPLVLGQFTKAEFNSAGDEDYFKLALPDKEDLVLTLELIGRPRIRTSLSLLDAAGKVTKRFDPSQLSAQQTKFSWIAQPKIQTVKVSESPTAVALVWGSAGATKESWATFERAVRAYLDQVGPTEQVNLIRFGGARTEVLLPRFTNNRGRLKTALQGKVPTGSGAPLYDAVAKGIELLDRMSGNRALVLMTDSADTASRLDHPGLWKLLREKQVRVYAIGLGQGLRTRLPRVGSTAEQVLQHAALATSGRYFFATSGNEIEGFLQEIATELRAAPTYYLKATLGEGPGSLDVQAVDEIAGVPSQIEFLLDSSDSMNLEVEGRAKLDIVKDALTKMIQGLPDDVFVALRVFGHRIPRGRRGACRDSELVFSGETIDKPALVGKLAETKALGPRPIAYSLRQLPRDLARAKGWKTVILVTDGKDDCRGSPAAAISELLKRRFKIRLNIVGFAGPDAGFKREMERIAELAGGRFFEVEDGKSLRQAMEESLAVPYDVLDASGTRVARGSVGRGEIQVPEGIYTVVIRPLGQPATVRNVRVSHGMLSRIELHKEGREIVARVLAPQGDASPKAQARNP